jgi:hypothetical protein
MSGKDIFLSYASDDRSRILPLARALESTGWSVFWDVAGISTGSDWREVLDKEACASRSTVVVWSRASVAKPFVREEAEVARSRNVLVPVRIDAVTPPLGFRSTQYLDLFGWDGAPSAPAFQRLITDLRRLLGEPPLRVTDEEERARAGGDRPEHVRAQERAAAGEGRAARERPKEAEERFPVERGQQQETRVPVPERLRPAILFQLACAAAAPPVVALLQSSGFGDLEGLLLLILSGSALGLILAGGKVFWRSRGTAMAGLGIVQGLVLPLVAAALDYASGQGWSTAASLGVALLGNLAVLAHSYYMLGRLARLDPEAS